MWVWLPGATEPVPAGLCRSRADQVLFAYGNRYLARPDRISLFAPELPLDVAGFHDPPDGLAIAGCLDDAGPDSWGRRVIVNRLVGRDADLDALDRLTFLLEAGSDRIGALDFQASPATYEPRGHAPAPIEDLLHAADLIGAGKPIPPALETAMRAGSSVGGARPKALISADGEAWIAKFSAPADPYPVVKYEFVAMRLAAACGLSVAEVRLVEVDGRDVLLVKRFDRPGDGTRRQVISALTILGLPDAAPSLASYGQLAQIMRRDFSDPAVGRCELFGRMVFNVLCGNTDDHARNHAAFWDGRELTLTPAYDIAPLPRAGGEAQQAMRLGGADDPDRFSQVWRCVERAPLFGLTALEATELADRQRQVIADRFDEICDAAALARADRELLRAVCPHPYALYEQT